jgi:hypothetical protein
MAPRNLVAGYRSFGGKLRPPSSGYRSQEARRSVFLVGGFLVLPFDPEEEAVRASETSVNF